MKNARVTAALLIAFLILAANAGSALAVALPYCPHDYLTYNDYKKISGWSGEYYWIDTATIASADRDKIDSAVQTWKGKTTKVPINRTLTKSNACIEVIGGAIGTTGYIGATWFYYSSSSPYNPKSIPGATKNYYGNIIQLDFDLMVAAPPMSTAQIKATVMHEFGHAFGLDHNSAKDSIMCQHGAGRTATSPNTTDVKAVNHLY